jgi:hypothetical protein
MSEVSTPTPDIDFKANKLVRHENVDDLSTSDTELIAECQTV